MRISAAPFLLSVLLTTACTPAEPTPAVSAEPAAAPVAEPPSTDQTAPATPAPGTPTRPSPDTLARHLRQALDNADATLVTYYLEQFSAGMSSHRGNWGNAMDTTLRAFAQANQAELWQRMQSPVIIPVLEGLLDLQDWAALARLTRAFAHGPAEDQIRSYAALVEPRHTESGRIELLGCAGTIDGEPATAELRLPGSWLVGCVDHPPSVVLVYPHRITRVLTENGIVAHIEAQQQPAVPTP